MASDQSLFPALQAACSGRKAQKQKCAHEEYEKALRMAEWREEREPLPAPTDTKHPYG